MSKVGEYERELRAMQDDPAYILRNGVREDKSLSSSVRPSGWIEILLPIIEDYRDGGEALDGDEVDSLCSILRAKINLHEGNITETEYNNILDGGNK